MEGLQRSMRAGDSMNSRQNTLNVYCKIAESSARDIQTIINRIAILVGAQKPSVEEMEVITVYVAGNFAKLRLHDLEKAFSLLIQERIYVESRDFVKISPRYLELVVTAYKRHNAELNRNSDSDDEFLTEGEKRVKMIDALCQVCDTYKRTGYITDYGGAGIRFLLNEGLFIVPDEIEVEYMNLAKKQQIEEINAKMLNNPLKKAKLALGKNDKEMIRYQAGALMMAWYFDKLEGSRHLRSLLNER